jgi:Tol biopolymer transport system component
MRSLLLASALTMAGSVLACAAEPVPPAPSGPPPVPVAARNLTASVEERNEHNPRFSPDGKRLSFERREGSSQAIYVVDLAADGAAPVRVSSAPARAAASAEEALLGSARPSDESFNTQLSFFPNGRDVVFTGNGTAGVYRIFRGTLGGRFDAIAGDSKEEGHPAVSPDGRFLVYVAARRGVGKLYLRDLTTGVERPLTDGASVDLFPAWSPTSKALAYTSGENDNHDVYLIPDVTAPAPARVALTAWKFDDLRPVFSPDGKRIAFYTNFSPSGQEREWSIVVVSADGTTPNKGTPLAERAVATDVIKDPEIGPAWLPDSRRIVYARNVKAEFNPIWTVDVDTRAAVRLDTGTRMNHDLTCASDGTLAFRAQVKSWDDIFVASLPPGPVKAAGETR